MAEPIPLPLSFKGSRDYLQGPDIFDALQQVLPPHGWERARHLDMSFHHLAREAVVAELLSADAPKPEDATAILSGKIDGNTFRAAVRSSGRPVESRRPFPEEQIVAATSLDLSRSTISLDQPLPFTNCELIVALNKALHQQLFPEARGKWLFTRLQLETWLAAEPYSHLQLTLEANLNFAITRTRIEADGTAIGRVFFSLLLS